MTAPSMAASSHRKPVSLGKAGKCGAKNETLCITTQCVSMKIFQDLDTVCAVTATVVSRLLGHVGNRGRCGASNFHLWYAEFM